MRQHARRGRPEPHGSPPHGPEDEASPPKRQRHPLIFAIGALIVIGVAGAAGYAIWTLYSDSQWRSSARESSEAVAAALQAHSLATDTPPRPVDAVAGVPESGQVRISSLPYAADIPASVARFRLSPEGSLSVLTTSQALCSGVSMDLTDPGEDPSGRFGCGDLLAPQTPSGLVATARDESVLLDWALPPEPVEDYRISVSSDGGTTWRVIDEGASANTNANIRPLDNGREYVFAVSAVNLLGESPPATATASPFSRPGEPTNVQAEGGFTAVVRWSAPINDGGRPITGYLVSGEPSGSCTVPATVTECVFEDLPAARGYTFIVRAVNEAGLGEPNQPAAGPVVLYSRPGPPVAILASPGDRVVLLTWTPPLRDGNTPITDYLVEYRTSGSEEWQMVEREPSTQTAAAVSGLVNGTAYEFRVRAVNAVGESEPPVSLTRETPATVPGVVTALERQIGDESVTLTWSPPVSDGSAEITDYRVQYRSGTGAWVNVDEAVDTALTRTVTDLVNGTRYAFRVAAVNRIGDGPWSEPIPGRPVGPPGPVVEPESIGSLTEIELTWKPPENDGGRPLQGYRVDYRLSAEPDWIRAARVPADVTTLIVGDLEGGESYDFRIVAINAVGFGPANPEESDRPTLAGVIADETPAAPEGLTAVPGDGIVTLTWEASPAGKKSPITAYTVTGKPSGECITQELTCVIRGLTNGVRYSFTVTAENANIIGEPSRPVRATPMLFNAATGGVESTYVRDGRTYRVHTFTQGGTLTVTTAAQPFSVLVVGGGGGSAQAPGGPLYPGGGGGVIDAPQLTLPTGPLRVVVGAGGPPGLPGGVSLMDGVGTAPAGPVGAATQTEFTSPITSDASGKPRRYGKAGTATSGQGRDGRGEGGGGPALSRGGNGIVIVSYEVAG